MFDPILRLKDVAKELGLSYATIKQYRSRGILKLPMTKIGKTLIIRESVFSQWINENARVT
jgi:predicted site-specific integrase-resolvase